MTRPQNTSTLVLPANRGLQVSSGIQLFNLLRQESVDDVGVVTPGVVLGPIARRQIRSRQDRAMLVPIKHREVAWAREGREPRSRRLPGPSGMVNVTHAAIVDWDQPEVAGRRPIPYLAEHDGVDGSAIALIQLGLVTDRRRQHELLAEILNAEEEIYPIGVQDLGGTKVDRKFTKLNWGFSHLKADGGVTVTTRANLLVQIQPGGEALMAGLLAQDGVYRLVNDRGRVKIVEPSGPRDPREVFEELAYGTPESNEDVVSDATDAVEIESVA